VAGDWIPMRASLWTDPRVVKMSAMCPQNVQADALANCARVRIVGGLWRIWCLADEHSEDGTLPHYTPEVIDMEVGVPGFAAAMESVGWLVVTPEGVSLPRFTDRNGQSAKRRIKDAERKRVARKPVRKTSASVRTESGPQKRREEKRTEDIRYEEDSDFQSSDSSSRLGCQSSFILAISDLFSKEPAQRQSDHTSAYTMFDGIWPEGLPPQSGRARVKRALAMVDEMKPSVKNRMAWLTNRLKKEWR